MAVAEWGLRVVDGIGGLVDGLRFAGECGLGDLESHGSDDAAVGGHRVAGLELHDVAGDEIGAGKFDTATVTQDPRVDTDICFSACRLFSARASCT